MAKQLAKQSEKQIFSILEAQLRRQDEQGRTIHAMFDGIKSMYGEFAEGMEEMKMLVQEVRDSKTLTDTECYELQSAVAMKSISLTKDRISEEEESFPKVVGKYRWMIWKHLKRTYHVPKYNHIRRIDFEAARSFVQNFRPEDYI
jgi:hypothetical protein